MATAIEYIGVGLVAGLISGMLGVGGGVVLVPALVILLRLDQHHAEGTSLIAIIPVVLVGALSQRRYGNVRTRAALTIGVASVGGAAGGVVLANALSGRALRYAFAALIILIAARLVRRVARARGSTAPAPALEREDP